MSVKVSPAFWRGLRGALLIDAILIALLVAWVLAGCSSGSSAASSDPGADPPVTQADCEPGDTLIDGQCIAPAPPGPTCAAPQIAAGTSCICPVSEPGNGPSCTAPPCQGTYVLSADGMSCVIPTCPFGDAGSPPNCYVPSPPPCPAGTTLNAGGQCVAATLCPQPLAQLSNGECSCPVLGEALAGGMCACPVIGETPLLGTGASVLSCLCPPNAPYIDTTTNSCTATNINGAGTGGGTASSCTYPSILIDGSDCAYAPLVTVSATLTQTQPITGCPTGATCVVDNSLGCPDPAGDPCTATITVTASAVMDGTLTPVPGGDMIMCDTPVPPTAGPYPPQSQVAGANDIGIPIQCTDQYGVSANQTAYLTVLPAIKLTGDTLTGSLANNVETLSWTTYGGESCYALQTNGLTLATTDLGSGPNDIVSSSYLPSSDDPWTFQLYCNGIPDPGVAIITVNP